MLAASRSSVYFTYTALALTIFVHFHSDRYERLLRQKSLTKGSDGVAVIEYEDGEREMVDLKMETFRSCRDSDDEGDKDDDTVHVDGDINNFSLVVQGEWIDILWKHAGLYFPCKIISWTPIPAKKSLPKEISKKRTYQNVTPKQSTRPKLPQCKEKSKRQSMEISKKELTTKDRNGLVDNDGKVLVDKDIKDSTMPSSMGKGQSKKSEPEFPPLPPILPPFRNDADDRFYSSDDSSEFSTDESYVPVDRVGHGIPLYDEPEGDFDSSDDDVSDDDDDRDGMDSYQYRSVRDRPKLSFEELWTLKLKRTQEFMYRRDCHGSNGKC